MAIQKRFFEGSGVWLLWKDSEQGKIVLLILGVPFWKWSFSFMQRLIGGFIWLQLYKINQKKFNFHLPDFTSTTVQCAGRKWWPWPIVSPHLLAEDEGYSYTQLVRQANGCAHIWPYSLFFKRNLVKDDLWESCLLVNYPIHKLMNHL